MKTKSESFVPKCIQNAMLCATIWCPLAPFALVFVKEKSYGLSEVLCSSSPVPRHPRNYSHCAA